MKNIISRFLYHTTAYSVAITLAFFLFANLTSVQEPQISLGRFALIILFSAIISAAEFLFAIEKMPKILSYVLHYAALFVTFLIVFISINNSEITPSFVFAAIIIFTVIYGVIMLSVILFKKLTKKSESNEKPKKNDTKKSGGNEWYTPKFGG